MTNSHKSSLFLANMSEDGFSETDMSWVSFCEAYDAGSRHTVLSLCAAKLPV